MPTSHHTQEKVKDLFNPISNKIIVVPFDYGMYKGPIPELCQFSSILPSFKHHGVNALLLHKGLIKYYRDTLQKTKIPYFLHATASTGLACTEEKAIVGTVEEALALQAVGLSFLVYLGNTHETQMLTTLSALCKKATEQGLLTYGMMYVAHISQERKQPRLIEQTDLHSVQWAARVGFELGIDIIEVRYPDERYDLQSLRDICPTPLVIADSSKFSNEEYFAIVDSCMSHRIDGISLSKRVFNSALGETLLEETAKKVHGNK